MKPPAHGGVFFSHLGLRKRGPGVRCSAAPTAPRKSRAGADTDAVRQRCSQMQLQVDIGLIGWLDAFHIYLHHAHSRI